MGQPRPPLACHKGLAAPGPAAGIPPKRGTPMTEQSSGTHGPREDDALKREVRSDLQAHRETRAEEWLEAEPPGEDEPEATWAPAGRPGAAPPGPGRGDPQARRGP